MAIDLVGENTISLKEAANVLLRRNGKKVNFGTVWRWANRGLRGARLETLRVGRGTIGLRGCLALLGSDSLLPNAPRCPLKPPAEWVGYLQMAAMAEG